jgi:hypothetical protein
MTQPFVAQLRSRPETIRIAPQGVPAITIRVEMPEVWDTVRIVASPNELVLTIKVRALEALAPDAQFHGEFVLKFRGWEILDESARLTDLGIGEGAILLLTYRRRRAVR